MRIWRAWRRTPLPSGFVSQAIMAINGATSARGIPTARIRICIW